uniref:Toll like receptor 8 n=1 Tax=Latimeria chalumnae TaxID=7897 RepID=H3BAI6_LATCH
HFLYLVDAASKILAQSWVSRDLPCDIKVKNNGSIIEFDCSARHLTAVPSNINQNATNLKLSNNHIQSITKKLFHKLQNLTIIDLRWNCHLGARRLKHGWCERGIKIENGSFSSLTNLKQLLLDGNHLSKIPARLPISLNQLNMKHNSIFNLITGIQTLYLDKNCYYDNQCKESFYVEEGAFSHLTMLSVLSLSYDNITRVPKMLPVSLRKLCLKANKIESVNQNDFETLTDLEALDLSENCPRCFNAPFPCHTCEKKSIQIHPNAFRNNTRLKKLFLASNSLTHIHSTWFANFSQLMLLDLSLNYLVNEIATGEFLNYLPHLEELDLSMNYKPIPYSYPQYINLSQSFSSLVSLKKLYIRGYVFKEVDERDLHSLFALKNLSVLDLAINFIKEVDLKAFCKFQNLSMINLSENRVSFTSSSKSNILGTLYKEEDRHHEANNAPAVMLSYSRTHFSYSFWPQCSSYGKTLDLSKNSIFFINPEQFKGFDDIACLNLSKNAIGDALNGTEFVHLSNLKYLDITNNKIDLAYDYAFVELQKLEVLDLSYNYHYFDVESVTHKLGFIQHLPVLKVLNLSYNEVFTLTESQIISKSLKEFVFKNRLDILWKDTDSRYIHIFKNLINLTHLDIRQNRLKNFPQEAFLNLPKSLVKLYISNNYLKNFDWQNLRHFPHLELLDLGSNRLTVMTNNLHNLTKSLHTLVLRRNKISHLPAGFLDKDTSLKYLDLSFNKLFVINQSTFLSGAANYLEVLVLKGNPFQCTCEITEFIMWIHSNNVIIPQLATDVTCATPTNHKGQGIIYFDLHACALDNLSALFCLMSLFIIIITMVVVVTKNLFYWDYHFCVARMKKPIVSGNSIYDAYVAYDTKDPTVTDWVVNELCVHLENEKRSFLLCLEERDWEPGIAIVNNLSRSITESRKTVFVLTDKYVKSGTFRTAFYYYYMTHQRLMDENMDVIVLIVLEPVLQHSQYLRLRRRLCGSSILDWPINPDAERFFWQSLRNVIATDNTVRYNKMYKESIL